MSVDMDRSAERVISTSRYRVAPYKEGTILPHCSLAITLKITKWNESSKRIVLATIKRILPAHYGLVPHQVVRW